MSDRIYGTDRNFPYEKLHMCDAIVRDPFHHRRILAEVGKIQ